MKHAMLLKGKSRDLKDRMARNQHSYNRRWVSTLGRLHPCVVCYVALSLHAAMLHLHCVGSRCVRAVPVNPFWVFEAGRKSEACRRLLVAQLSRPRAWPSVALLGVHPFIIIHSMRLSQWSTHCPPLSPMPIDGRPWWVAC